MQGAGRFDVGLVAAAVVSCGAVDMAARCCEAHFPRPTAAVSAVALSSGALPERAPAPASVLHRAPIQVEVTVLSVEEKPGVGGDRNIWHRIRVERVLAGSDLGVGDEVAVVSVVRHSPPGTTGSSGDRGGFGGPNGLPVKGDRARLFAEGGPEILRPVPPNGWQGAQPVVAFLAADEEFQSDRTMPFLASMIEKAGVAETSLHLATTTDRHGSPNAAPQQSAKENLTSSHRLRFADAAVLAVHGLRPSHNASLALDSALRGGLPIVAFGRSQQDLSAMVQAAPPRADERSDAAMAPSVRVRIEPPDEASAGHPILTGVKIPSDGLVVASRAARVALPTEGARVLLWGVVESPPAGGAAGSERRPVLWVQEIPRQGAGNQGGDRSTLPPQRVVITTLGGLSDFDLPEFRLIAVQAVAWAIDRVDLVTDETRRTVRGMRPSAGAGDAPLGGTP